MQWVRCSDIRRYVLEPEPRSESLLKSNFLHSSVCGPENVRAPVVSAT